jgi:hypothetical protein
MPPKKKTLVESDSETDVIVSKTTGTTSSTTSSSSTAATAAKKTTNTTSGNVVLKSNQNDSDRLLLAQSIHNLVARGEAFTAALDSLQQFSKEKLLELDMKIETKKKEYQDLCVQMENSFKDTEIKMRQNLAENKLQAVKEVLAGLDMISIKTSLYEELNKNMDQVKKDFADQLTNAVKAEQEKGTSALKQATMNMELSHKADVAALKAQVDQQKNEIIVLRDTIQNLKFELAEQRNLTKEVAIAGSKSQISQSFAK